LSSGLETSATGAMGAATAAADAVTAAALGIPNVTPSGAGNSGQLALGGLASLPADQVRELHMMNARYRAKLLRDARERASLKKHDLEQLRSNEIERRDRERKEAERELRLHDIERIWQTAILPKWPVDGSPVPVALLSKASQLALSLGVPPRLRGIVWPLAIGNRLRITPEVFSTISSRAASERERYAEIKEALDSQPGLVESATFYYHHGLPGEQTQDSTNSNNIVQRLLQDQGKSADEAKSLVGLTSGISLNAPLVEAGDVALDSAGADKPRLSWSAPRREFDKSATFRDVDVDLNRTFPHLAFFQDGCPMKLQMRAILDAYCFFRPDIGYVQGMSYLAGKLLLYMSEYEAFVCLANMMETSYFRSMFLMDELSDARFQFFCDYFKENLPDLYNHFENVEILAYGKSLYFVEWGMTLFCKRLELDVVGRIWDCYFMLGEQVVYRAAVAMLAILKPQLMGEPFENCHKILTKQSYEIPEDKLMNVMATIKWKPAHDRRLQELLTQAKQFD